MTPFYVYDTTTGRIIRGGVCQPDMLDAQATKPGEKVVEGVARPDMDRIVDGVLTAMPERPGPQHMFDYSTNQWVAPAE